MGSAAWFRVHTILLPAPCGWGCHGLRRLCPFAAAGLGLLCTSLSMAEVRTSALRLGLEAQDLAPHASANPADTSPKTTKADANGASEAMPVDGLAVPFTLAGDGGWAGPDDKRGIGRLCHRRD
jgi:hypothetical protein